MKNIRTKFLALLLITSAAFFSCKKGDPIPPHMRTVTEAPATNNPTLTRGEWRIAMFSKNGTDRTVDFRGYVFMFNSDGILKVTKNNNSSEGAWLASPGATGFMIHFASVPFNELNNDWQIKGETYNDLKLVHENVDGGTDILTFSRNQQE